MNPIKKGSKGSKVVDIQRRLRLLGHDLGPFEIDGIFGDETEKALKSFQKERSVSVTGIVDDECWQELVDSGYSIGDRMLYLKEPPFRGDDVKVLQLWLKSLGFYKAKENAVFNRATQKALIEFQKNMKLGADGLLGEGTLLYLKNLHRIINEKEIVNYPAERSFKNKKTGYKIIFDYGIFSSDMKEKGKDFFEEKIKICSLISNKSAAHLKKKGFEVLFTASENTPNIRSVYKRIKKANSLKADLLISININFSENINDKGASCFYFKGLKSFSVEGKKITEILKSSLSEDLKSDFCNTDGSSVAILKETNMTAVILDLGYISNPDDKEKLNDSDFQEYIAVKVAEALKKYFIEINEFNF